MTILGLVNFNRETDADRATALGKYSDLALNRSDQPGLVSYMVALLLEENTCKSFVRRLRTRSEFAILIICPLIMVYFPICLPFRDCLNPCHSKVTFPLLVLDDLF